MILLSATTLMAGLAGMEIGERALTAAVFTMLSLAVVLLYRRFSRSIDDVPAVFRAAAAIGVVLGVLTIVSGAAHSAAVTALAFREGEWAPLTIFRFTTGIMLMYAGAMSVALRRAIRAGRRWAIGVSAATSLLFWTYLMLAPTPWHRWHGPADVGTLGRYFLWLGAAALATMPPASHLRLDQHA